ncbi:MAG: hypothetical protein MJK04_22895, partial [Psychrosphaera sp.]|nr:hypothetical protein [Psychrosphaera sp.]
PQISRYALMGQETLNWQEIGNGTVGWPSKLALKPGKYTVRFHCVNGDSYAFPIGSFDAKQGKIYYSRCFMAEGGKVGVEIIEGKSY